MAFPFLVLHKAYTDQLFTKTHILADNIKLFKMFALLPILALLVGVSAQDSAATDLAVVEARFEGKLLSLSALAEADSPSRSACPTIPPLFQPRRHA